MGTFNIDFNQFKPSSRGGVAMPSVAPTPTTTQMPKPTMPSMQTQAPQTTTTPQPQVSSKGKIFTGSTLQKILDVPMLPGYAFAGFQKGAWEELDRQRQSGVRDRGVQLRSALKGAWEGVKNRADFGTQPEDINVAERFGIKNPGWQTAVNLGLSLAVPNLSISKGSKFLSKIPGVSNLISKGSKIIDKVTDVAKTVPAIYKPIETFSPYFRRPEVGKIVRGAEESATGRVNQVFNQIADLSKGLTREQQIEVGKIIEGAKSNDKQLVAIARQAQNLGSSIGQELIDQGLLPKNTKLGQYLPHIFDVAKQEDIMRNRRSIPTVIGSFFKKRTGKEGYLPEFAPSLFKGLGTEVKDIEINKMFKELADKYGTRVTRKASVPEGYVWAKDVVKNENLKKLFKRTAIPSDIADYIARTFPKGPENVFKKAFLDATNIWKAGKTISNPAYHARNILSNQILSGMATGRGVLRTAYDTLSNLKSSEWKKIATDAGLIGRKTVTKGFEELQDMNKLRSGRNVLSRAAEGVQRFQQGSEEASKLTVFRATLEDLAEKNNVPIQEAIKNKAWVRQAVDKAEEAIFSPYRISQAERDFIGTAIPFYSFARQALPFTLKTLAENPERVTKYKKTFNAIEGMSGEDRVPAEQRTQGYKQQIQLPGKDKEGKTRFFDPTYIVPWGNFGTQTSGASGIPIMDELGLSFHPFVTEAFQQKANRNFYFDQPITKSLIPRVQKKEKLGSIARMIEPTFLTNLRTKVAPAVAGKPDQYGRTRSIPQALIDTLFGLKTSNKNIEEMKQGAEKSKVFNLRSILQSEGEILRDKTLSEAERARQIMELRQLYQQSR